MSSERADPRAKPSVPGPYLPIPQASNTVAVYSISIDAASAATGDHDAVLLAKLRAQVEFYFGPQNLARDTYLRSLLATYSGSAVPLSVIAAFPKVRELCATAFGSGNPNVPADPALLMRAVDGSSVVAVTPDALWISPILPVPPLDPAVHQRQAKVAQSRAAASPSHRSGNSAADNSTSAIYRSLSVDPSKSPVLQQVNARAHSPSSQHSHSSSTGVPTAPIAAPMKEHTTVVLPDAPPDCTLKTDTSAFNFENTTQKSARPDPGNSWFVTFATESGVLAATAERGIKGCPVRAQIKSESALPNASSQSTTTPTSSLTGSGRPSPEPSVETSSITAASQRGAPPRSLPAYSMQSQQQHQQCQPGGSIPPHQRVPTPQAHPSHYLQPQPGQPIPMAHIQPTQGMSLHQHHGIASPSPSYYHTYHHHRGVAVPTVATPGSYPPHYLQTYMYAPHFQNHQHSAAFGAQAMHYSSHMYGPRGGGGIGRGSYPYVTSGGYQYYDAPPLHMTSLAYRSSDGSVPRDSTMGIIDQPPDNGTWWAGDSNKQQQQHLHTLESSKQGRKSKNKKVPFNQCGDIVCRDSVNARECNRKDSDVSAKCDTSGVGAGSAGNDHVSSAPAIMKKSDSFIKLAQYKEVSGAPLHVARSHTELFETDVGADGKDLRSKSKKKKLKKREGGDVGGTLSNGHVLERRREKDSSSLSDSDDRRRKQQEAIFNAEHFPALSPAHEKKNVGNGIAAISGFSGYADALLKKSKRYSSSFLSGQEVTGSEEKIEANLSAAVNALSASATDKKIEPQIETIVVGALTRTPSSAGATAMPLKPDATND